MITYGLLLCLGGCKSLRKMPPSVNPSELQGDGTPTEFVFLVLIYFLTRFHLLNCYKKRLLGLKRRGQVGQMDVQYAPK